ncbi:uncharacterized protein GGS22DRAFT_3512 [Annulohypoxylon maeteangense]|uniref:uncharacterized protein n=1 Tax=Annulohypoxylon maeteangense TaxID=1927788 RepID=UPI002007A443|nr:uncharacterized protein GGS22DRAFT_3512 [Annulohypoxylon maeteangense]KAI0889744.1 hypothetical protein GGS22DRAFT_3512 [Annulohypoxylon maeteangense]
MTPLIDGSHSGDATQDYTAKLAACEKVLKRAELVQSEVQRFVAHVEDVYSDYFQHMLTYVHTSFSHELRAEIESLERTYRELQSENHRTLDRAQSSNIAFLEPVWETAKRSRDIVRLRCAVSTGPFKNQILAPGTRIVRTQGQSQSRSGTFIIDVIADGGHSWSKVSSMTNKRVLFDLAKEAIYYGDSDDDEDTEPAIQDYSDIPLVKLARNLADTAKGHRIQTKSPSTFLILPRIKEGVCAEVDKVLEVCRQLGVTLLCGEALSPAPPFSDDLLHIMAPSPKANFTDVLNIDTSLLVALASDFSHTNVVKQPWFSPTHNDHVDLESERPMLSLVYPMIGNHKLVCTKEAADTFFHIVDTLATDSEKARAYLILSPDSGKSQEQRVKESQPLSIHEVPPYLQLPISIIDLNDSNCQYRLTDPIKKTLESVLNPGRSVFSYGWAGGLTTLTCNSVIVKQLEKDLERLPTLGDLPWPSIWAFPTSRPFVGVPRDSRKQVRKHIGDCSVTCTCGVDELYGHRSNVTII